MIAGESDSTRSQPRATSVFYFTEERGAVGKDVSAWCHVLVVGDSCLPTKFGFIFSTQYLLDREKSIVRFLFSTPYLFDREKRCWGFGGCSAIASEFLSPNYQVRVLFTTQYLFDRETKMLGVW